MGQELRFIFRFAGFATLHWEDTELHDGLTHWRISPRL